MSYTRKECEETVKAELDAVKKCLSAEQQDKLRRIVSRLNDDGKTDKELNYKLAITEVSRMVLEGSPNRYIQDGGTLKTERQIATEKAAAWFVQNVLENETFG